MILFLTIIYISLMPRFVCVCLSVTCVYVCLYVCIHHFFITNIIIKSINTPYTQKYIHTHTRTHTHTHTCRCMDRWCFNCSPSLSLVYGNHITLIHTHMCCMSLICMCVCVCVYVCTCIFRDTIGRDESFDCHKVCISTNNINIITRIQ